MEIHGPTAISDGIIEMSLPYQIILIQGILAEESTAFPLSGNIADPFQR